MKINNKAFTLTELLVALGIIGAIAAISIPSLMTRIQNRMFVTNLKSTTEAIKLLADKQLITSPSRTLEGTDFDSITKLFTTNNFNLAKSICSNSDNTCWRTKNYKTLKNTSSASKSRPDYRTVKLKNGATMTYARIVSGSVAFPGTPREDTVYGHFYIDVNGDDFPNIAGRDYFEIYVSKRGKLYPNHDIANNFNSVNGQQNCINGSADACYGVIVDNGWKMPY